jgi:hypothetical protein|tara:strand:+ start:369 stop:578 length:210 start_codon:yes stop_codon:yes gene_type:complete
MIEIGDLVEVTTPDDDDGKIGVVTERGDQRVRPRGMESVSDPPWYDVLLLGDSEAKNFLCWEVVKRESQ